MVNQDGEPSKDTFKVNTVPADKELAREYQARLHKIITAMSDEDGIGLGPTLPILRNEVSYVESMLNNTMTVERMLPKWLSNFSINYPKHFMNRCNPHDISGKVVKNSALVVGGGPSIQDYFEFEPIDDYKGTLICTNKSYKKILEHDLYPDYVVVLHGTDDILTDFSGWVADMMGSGNTKFILATTIHPSVADQICKYVPNDKIMWFNASIGNELASSYDLTLSLLTGIPTMCTGGNVGILSTVIAKNIGAKAIGLYGLEHCQKLDGRWSNEAAYSMEIRYAPEEDIIYAMSSMFRAYIKQFYQFISENPDIQFINLVKNGMFYVDRKKLGIPYMDMKEFVSKYD